jgi:hypothetical protein
MKNGSPAPVAKSSTLADDPFRFLSARAALLRKRSYVVPRAASSGAMCQDVRAIGACAS